MARRHRRHANPFTVRAPPAAPDLDALFGRRAPRELDIGFGKGEFLLGLAASEPGRDYIGVELRAHLTERLLTAAATAGLHNIAALTCNVNAHLEALLPPASLAAVYVQFPDPWFKQRHHKRRVVTPDFVALLARLLADEGRLELVTDQAMLAEDMLAATASCAALVNRYGPGQAAPEREHFGPVPTDREAWHLARGDRLYRYRFRRLSRKSP